MIRKILGLSIVLGLFVSTTALADAGPGCGMGAEAWKGKKGLIPHVLAATTNDIVSNQAFGISLGTLRCTDDAVVKTSKEQEAFVATNLDKLSLDMAQGSGAHLDSLATLLGCTGEASVAFARMTQEKYGVLFTGETTSTGMLLTGLKREIRSDVRLASACTRVS